MPMYAPAVRDERGALRAFLELERQAIRNAVHGLTDGEARTCPTKSELTLGGLVKHVSYGEEVWLARVRQTSRPELETMDRYVASLRMEPGDTLDELLRGYAEVAHETDDAIAQEDLDRPVPLPQEPWFPRGCTVRHVFFHLIEETARHAGHADLLRESLDGALSGPLMAAAEGWPESGFVTPWRRRETR